MSYMIYRLRARVRIRGVHWISTFEGFSRLNLLIEDSRKIGERVGYHPENLSKACSVELGKVGDWRYC